MKLKKLLAGVTAAALAVSAMTFSSLTASAEDAATGGSAESKEFTISTDAVFKYDTTQKAYAMNKDVVDSWGKDKLLKCADYEKIEMTYTATDEGWGNAASISLYVNGSKDDDPNTIGWKTETAKKGENKTITITFDDSNAKQTFEAVGYQLLPDDTVKVSEGNPDVKFTGSIKGTIKLYKKATTDAPADDTDNGVVVYDSTKDTALKFEGEENRYNFEIAKSKCDWSNAEKITVTVEGLKADDSGNGGFYLQETKSADWLCTTGDTATVTVDKTTKAKDKSGKEVEILSLFKESEKIVVGFYHVTEVKTITIKVENAAADKPEETKPVEFQANVALYTNGDKWADNGEGTKSLTVKKAGDGNADLSWEKLGGGVTTKISEAGVMIYVNEELYKDFKDLDGQDINVEITNIKVTDTTAAKEEDTTEGKTDKDTAGEGDDAADSEKDGQSEGAPKAAAETSENDETEQKKDETSEGDKTEQKKDETSENTSKPTEKADVKGKYTLKLKDTKDAVQVLVPIASITTDDLGKKLELNVKVSLAEAESTTPTNPDSGSTTPSTPSAPTVSGNKHQGIGMPPVVINQKSAPAASTGAAASGSTSVTLSNSTVVSKDAIDSIAGKDAEFKLANGASWEIAAADVAKAEGMDLGITLNTKTATAAQLKEIAKDNDTFQFSLTFSGDFGFSAVINIPVDAKNNGKYANLYWFNNGKFEFIGSSKVEGGIADFTMKHASDYVIVFDDEAYGEDVSSGAGVYEESETSSAAPAAVVVTFAALAVSAVILKKRVF